MKTPGIGMVIWASCIVLFSNACTKENLHITEAAPSQNVPVADQQQVSLPNSTARIAQLSDEQIRSYLHYYSPIIFKQANEYDESHKGYDWITNFNYDQDNYLANNKDNWENQLTQYVNQGQPANWQIRPTLYSSAILFRDNELQTNSVILLYHVYHAKQRFEIHDWERIEIRIDQVNGSPGTGEEMNYVVITRHSLHNAREYPHEDLNFMTTPSGKHVLIWQADWDFSVTNPAQAELHFVEASWSTVESLKASNGTAKVDINDEDKTRFHYVFVDEADAYATEFWNAQTINAQTAQSLVSGKGQSTSVSMSEVKKIKYELQDLADIIPTHLNPQNWKNELLLNIVTPVISETGATEVSAGVNTFYQTSIDSEDPDEDREGYVHKHWFWGVYIYATEGDSFYAELGPEPWYQHLYFAHNGTRGDGSVAYELTNSGIFLGKGAYQNWNTTDGGFDGRWVQLFQD